MPSPGSSTGGGCSGSCGSGRETTSRPSETLTEPASFRDPDSKVFYAGGAVFRALSASGLADWTAFAATRLFRDETARGRIVATEEVAPSELAPELEGQWAGLLRHERVPLVSYPYEWPFGMLKDATLLQLELLEAALDEDMTLKDASPYNVQWRGSRPVFVDVGSFERLRPGEPWAGYRQLCTLSLYPLMLQAYKGVPFQPWLRGRIDGIDPADARAAMSARDLLRPGVFTHVALHSRLERRYADRRRDVKRELRAAGFGKELIKANARRLAKLVRRLEWTPPRSEWSGYADAAPYTAADAARKAAFVHMALVARKPRLVWDLGANEGVYSRLAAQAGAYVVAADADHAVVERLYRALAAEGSDRVLPLVVDVADPSPGLGWRGVERRRLDDRGRPELTLCLALLHHLAITRNVPVRDVLGWLRSLETSLVVEFATRDDPMVQRLLAPKREGLHDDYRREAFERRLAEAFSVERSEELASGTRVLYLAHPR